MVKYILFLFFISFTVNAITYRDFTEARELCYYAQLYNCTFKPIIKQGTPLSNQYLQCAQDYEKSNVCFYGYNQCYAKDNSTKYSEEMPLVCWNCYMESPSKSNNYQSFRKCLAPAYQSKLLLSLGLALAFIMLVLL